MVWGMSSWFVQVTLSPTFTVSCGGEKVKLSMVTAISAQCAADIGAVIAAAMTTRTPSLRRVAKVIAQFPSALQRCVDDRKALIAWFEVDAGDAEQAAKLVVGDLHRTGGR